MKRISQDKIDRIIFLITETDKSITEIAQELGISVSPVVRELNNLLTPEERKERHRKFCKKRVGELNSNYGNRKDSKHMDRNGYVLIPKPIWFTGRTSSRTVFEHHKVMCEHLGITEIPEGFCVHHKDLNKTNNSLDNLELLSFSAHTALHGALRNKNDLEFGC